MSLLALALVLAAPSLQEDTLRKWIPFEFFRDSYVFLEVSIDGVDTTAILDSGAGMSCVSALMAAELGLENGLPVAAEGIGGTVSAELFSGVTLEVGELKAEGVQVVAIDFREIAAGLGRDFPVILGRSFFTDYVVDIDYPNRRVAFHDRERFDYDGPGFELELHDTSSGLWAVELEIRGRSGRFLVDTGSGGPIGFDAAFARSCGLLEGGVRSTTTLAGGVGGMRIARITTLKELFVGDALLENVPARYSVDDEAGTPGEGEAGGIGSPLLGRFRALFDVGQQRLILEPHAERVAEPFAKNRVGLEVQLEPGGLRVVHVGAGSPAAAAGWEPGALVVEIDGERVDGSYWDDLFRWRQARAGTRIVLLDGEGKQHELTAADYY